MRECADLAFVSGRPPNPWWGNWPFTVVFGQHSMAFISIEADDVFGLALSVDESFELVLQTLVAGLEQG